MESELVSRKFARAVFAHVFAGRESRSHQPLLGEGNTARQPWFAVHLLPIAACGTGEHQSAKRSCREKENLFWVGEFFLDRSFLVHILHHIHHRLSLSPCSRRTTRSGSGGFQNIQLDSEVIPIASKKTVLAGFNTRSGDTHAAQRKFYGSKRAVVAWLGRLPYVFMWWMDFRRKSRVRTHTHTYRCTDHSLPPLLYSHSWQSEGRVAVTPNHRVSAGVHSSQSTCIRPRQRISLCQKVRPRMIPMPERSRLPRRRSRHSRHRIGRASWCFSW